MQGSIQENENTIVGHRYKLREMVAHQVHMITCVVLIITGLYMAVQFNLCTVEAWKLIPYQDLRLIHVVASVLFLLVNWTLIPFNLVKSGHMTQYIFSLADISRLKQSITGIFRPEKYPKYTIYNKSTGHYENKLHPAFKLMVIFEGIAIVLIGISGIIMIDLKFGIMDFNIPAWNSFMVWFVEDSIGSISIFIGMSGIEFIRTIHLWATYWFILELIIHLGFLGVDPRMTEYVKAMFLSGKEIMDENTTVIERVPEKRPILVFK